MCRLLHHLLTGPRYNVSLLISVFQITSLSHHMDLIQPKLICLCNYCLRCYGSRYFYLYLLWLKLATSRFNLNRTWESMSRSLFDITLILSVSYLPYQTFILKLTVSYERTEGYSILVYRRHFIICLPKGGVYHPSLDFCNKASYSYDFGTRGKVWAPGHEPPPSIDLGQFHENLIFFFFFFFAITV